MTEISMERIMEAQMAEQATGIPRAPVAFTLYKNGGATVTPEEARALLEAGESVEVPAAGAGSYREFAKLVGLEVADTLETSSSAGDWLLKLADGRVMFQRNRYPNYGFEYTVAEDNEN
jgi:hypothetical protein